MFEKDLITTLSHLKENAAHYARPRIQASKTLAICLPFIGFGIFEVQASDWVNREDFPPHFDDLVLAMGSTTIGFSTLMVLSSLQEILKPQQTKNRYWQYMGKTMRAIKEAMKEREIFELPLLDRENRILTTLVLTDEKIEVTTQSATDELMPQTPFDQLTDPEKTIWAKSVSKIDPARTMEIYDASSSEESHSDSVPMGEGTPLLPRL
ncbi:MAG: hypothetical protein JW855_02145 [Gammaproteobacteria bacterium]|nr:hypothetical protein [Gammaproteobacteria bacterium]